MSSATSQTFVLSSLLKCFTPSVIMVLQNGQATAITSGLCSSASLVLSLLTSFSPFAGSLYGFSDSLNNCAPPAPQQNPLALLLFISASSASSLEIISRGAS